MRLKQFLYLLVLALIQATLGSGSKVDVALCEKTTLVAKRLDLLVKSPSEAAAASSPNGADVTNPLFCDLPWNEERVLLKTFDPVSPNGVPRSYTNLIILSGPKT